MVQSWARFALLCCLFLVGIPGLARSAPGTMVVDLSGDAMAARQSLLEEIYGASFAPQPMAAAQALDMGTGPWAVSPADALLSCDASPASGAQLRQSLDTIETHMLALEYGEALPLLTALEAQLCAASEPVPAELLSRIFFLQGVALTYDDQPQGALSAFGEAIRLHPPLAWDDNFAPRPRSLFDEAATAAAQQATGSVRVDGDDRPARLFFDGVEVVAGDQILVAPVGRHLLQLEGTGIFITRWLEVREGPEVQLLGPDQLQRQLEAAPPSRAFDRLVEVAHQRGLTRIVVLRNAYAPVVWSYDNVQAEWTPITWAHHLKQRRARKTRTAGGIVLAIGGALTVGGAAAGITHYNQGYALIDEMQQDLGLYRLLIDEYEANRRGSRAGFTVMAVGGALLAAGLPMILHSSQVLRGTKQHELAFTIAPSPGGLSIHIRLGRIGVQRVYEDQ